jgi:bla regulator protein BlaR1
MFSLSALALNNITKVAPIFQNEEACFVLKEKNSLQPEVLLGQDNCQKKVAASELVFFPLVLYGIEKGLIQDEKTLFKWDGTRYADKNWNKDQFVTDWLRNRTGWVTDRLILQIGKEQLPKIFSRFQFSDPITSLEALAFSEKFFTEDPPIKNNFYQLAKRLFYLGKFRFGAEVWGQSSSNPQMARFAGHLAVKNKQYTFVTLLLPSKKSPEPLSADRAQALSMDALTELGLF